MFGVKLSSAKFDNLNTRIELHGDEKKPAADIGLTMALDADILDYFHPHLKNLLFQESKNTDEEDLFDGQEEQNDGVIDWRFRDLKKLDWDYDGIGYRFVIWSFLDKDEESEQDTALNEAIPREEDVVLIMTSVNKFKFRPLNNGKIELSLKVSGRPTPKEIGRLFELQGENIDVTLEPPKF